MASFDVDDMALILKGHVFDHLYTPKPGVVVNPLHSAADPDWYSPKDYVEAARHVMGQIDLDPASDEKANVVIQAKTFYTKEMNGLQKMWNGRVFLNPPGGMVNQFWLKLMDSLWTMSDGLKGVEEFVWIGFSLEQLQTLQMIDDGLNTPLTYSMCVPKKRIAFVENEAKREARLQKCLKEGKTFKEKVSPTHANYVSYHGPHKMKFLQVFEQFGEVKIC